MEQSLNVIFANVNCLNLFSVENTVPLVLSDTALNTRKENGWERFYLVVTFSL